MSALHDIDMHYMMPGLQRIATDSRLVIERGEGALLYDENNRRYIDMFAGVGVCSIGHAHPRFVHAVTDQLSKVSVGSFTTRVRAELVQLLATVIPEYLDRMQFYSGGSEAVEAALRLAKSFTGRQGVIGFWGAFHGKTLGALGICGTNFTSGHYPLPSGYQLAPYADCYHCSVFRSYPACGLACVHHMRDVISHTLKDELAAIVVEPIQGTNGNIVPPDGFLPALRELASEQRALLIVDEIITGFGRTGQMFISSNPGIDADIMVIGKGMANGLPMSGIIAKHPLVTALPFAAPSGSSSSFGGNPLSCAAALVTLQVILDEQLAENAQRVGEWLLRSLLPFETRYPFVGKIHGRGLMLGIELVQDKNTKEPLAHEITLQIFHRLLEKGVLMMAYGPKIRINPPLCISFELCEQAVAAIRQVFDTISADYF